MKNFSLSSKQDLLFFLKKEKFKRIFVLSGKKSYTLSGAKIFFDSILNNKITKFYFKISPYPEISELKNIIFAINKFAPDLIIAVGGGSVIDYAKIANVLEVTNNLSLKIRNSECKIEKKKSKLLVVPTTAGSGAEVTVNAVIYINKIKFSIENENIKPDYFFLVPDFVIKSPKKIKCSAGFDAISQAIESLISRKSNVESLNFAKKSLKISLKYFLEFLKKPNKENTSAMCIAANLSGKAISISKTTAPHAVSYPFTSFFDINHGHAVSLTLNKFLKFNYDNINYANCNFNLKKRYDILFELSKTDNFKYFDKYISDIKKNAGLEDNLKKLGINIKKNYSKIISGVNVQRLSNNPIKLKKKDIKDILFN